MKHSLTAHCPRATGCVAWRAPTKTVTPADRSRRKGLLSNQHSQIQPCRLWPRPGLCLEVSQARAVTGERRQLELSTLQPAENEHYVKSNSSAHSPMLVTLCTLAGREYLETQAPQPRYGAHYSMLLAQCWPTLPASSHPRQGVPGWVCRALFLAQIVQVPANVNSASLASSPLEVATAFRSHSALHATERAIAR